MIDYTSERRRRAGVEPRRLGGRFSGSSTPSTQIAPSLLGLEPSFGFGDRLGLATPGHVAALREAGGSIRGIFAQQSVREMTRTRRTPETVMQAAVDSLAALDYGDPWSADGDHLKTNDDVRRSLAAGFKFITLDPSDDVDQHADSYDETALAEKYADVRELASWRDQYRGRIVRLDSGPVEFSDQALMRATVKYARAVRRAMNLARFALDEASRIGSACELELSVDETAEPTTPAEHYIIAEQFRLAEIPLVSLAPRFVGCFEKGVEYKGDMAALESSVRLHAEIAERLGPYKISFHSGSDKISMYGLLARLTQGRFHVKTAGTSYLEALRVAAQCDPALFRHIVTFSRRHFDRDKASYCVSATVDGVPAPEAIDDPRELECTYLERWEDVPPGRGFTAVGRQILHCTFGSVLTDPHLGAALIQLVQDHPDEHCEILRQHFVRHLKPLNAG